MIILVKSPKILFQAGEVTLEKPGVTLNISVEAYTRCRLTKHLSLFNFSKHLCFTKHFVATWYNRNISRLCNIAIWDNISLKSHPSNSPRHIPNVKVNFRMIWECLILPLQKLLSRYFETEGKNTLWTKHDNL